MTTEDIKVRLNNWLQFQICVDAPIEVPVDKEFTLALIELVKENESYKSNDLISKKELKNNINIANENGYITELNDVIKVIDETSIDRR